MLRSEELLSMLPAEITDTALELEGLAIGGKVNTVLLSKWEFSGVPDGSCGYKWFKGVTGGY